MTRHHPTPEERAECIRLYSEGTMLKQLEHQFQRSRSTIKLWIQKAEAQRGHKFRRAA